MSFSKKFRRVNYKVVRVFFSLFQLITKYASDVFYASLQMFEVILMFSNLVFPCSRLAFDNFWRTGFVPARISSVLSWGGTCINSKIGLIIYAHIYGW